MCHRLVHIEYRPSDLKYTVHQTVRVSHTNPLFFEKNHDRNQIKHILKKQKRVTITQQMNAYSKHLLLLLSVNFFGIPIIVTKNICQNISGSIKFFQRIVITTKFY